MRTIDSLGFYNIDRLTKDIIKKDSIFLFAIDIKDFFFINYFYSQEVGNIILKKIGEQAKEHFNSSDIYRNNDCFYVIVEKNSELSTENILYKKILDFINYVKYDSIKVTKGNISLNLIVGISTNIKIEECILSLKAAKNSNKEIVIFKDSIIDNLLEESFTKNLIIDGEIVLNYQPIVDKNMKIVKYEVFSRIQHNNALHLPTSFIQKSTENKRYSELSKRIINKVFEDIKNSSKKASINLTYEDIYDEATRRLIKIFIKKYKDIKNIEFEIAEVEILKNYELVEAFINEVADLGASFCIDNFSATHSSFALLRSLKNIQSIKINNELTKNYKFNIAFLEAIVKIVKDLNIKITVQQIENEEMLFQMKVLGVDYFQGYHIGKPMPIESIKEGLGKDA